MRELELGTARFAEAPVSPSLRYAQYWSAGCAGLGIEVESLTSFGAQAFVTRLDSPNFGLGAMGGIAMQRLDARLSIGGRDGWYGGTWGEIRGGVGTMLLSDAGNLPQVALAAAWDLRLGLGPASFDLRIGAGFFEDTGILDLSPRLRFAVRNASLFAGWRLLHLSSSEDRPDLASRTLASGPEAGITFGF